MRAGRKTTRWIFAAVLAVAGVGGASHAFAQDRDRDLSDEHGAAPPPRGLAPYRDDADRIPAPADDRGDRGDRGDDRRAQTEMRQAFSQEELDQMLAPIALYPDALLSQVLMAATYPIEVVQADRWIKSHGNLRGDEMADALEQQPWEPSVKSLTNSPDVLQMMSEQLDWTVRLGDAFIGQERQVMDTVQKLRAKADEAGTLKSTPQQKVIIEREAPERVIVIEPAEPEVIYVPVYDPYVAYGRWWYPNYLPYRCYARPYPPGYNGIWFGLSFHYGSPWGYAWGRPDWRHRVFLVDVNRNVEFNRRIDRARYASSIERRDAQFHVDSGVWVHDARHRRGVYYRDEAVAQKFNSYSRDSSARSRDVYRGRVTNNNNTAATDPRGTPARQTPTVTSPKQQPAVDRNHDGKPDDNRSTRTDRSSRQPAPQPSTPINREGAKQRPPAPVEEKPAAAKKEDSSKPARDLSTRQREGMRTSSSSSSSDDPKVVRIMPGRDRGGDDAFSSVDRDGASVRGDSRRGEISRRPSLTREDFGGSRSSAPIARPEARPAPAPSRSSSPAPSPSRSVPMQPAGPNSPSNNNGGGPGGGGGSMRR